MAFRLQSALAGAAKAASAKIKAFDEDYADTLKNSAANLAKEAAQIRKDRMAAVRDYQKYGKRLQTNYGLSDAQVQTLLAGGVDQYEDFVDSIKNQQQIHVLSGQPGEFDATSAASLMFSGNVAQPDGILSIADQAQAYAAQQAPSTLDLEATAAGVAAGTRRGIFGVDQETAKAALQRTAGEFADLDTTGTVMSDTGLTVKGLGGLTADETIAARTAVAELQNLEARTEGTQQQTKLVAANTQAAETTNKTLPEQLQAELEATEATTALKQAQEKGVQQDTETAILSAEKLQLEINNYKTYGAENEQKALDLLDAKIFAANSPADLEQLQAMYLNQETQLRTQAASLDAADPRKQDLEIEANLLRTRASGVANMIKDADTTTSVDWSKGDPTSRFNAMLKTSLQNQDITGTMLSNGNWQWNFQDKRPAYITGFDNAVTQYTNQYGSSGPTGSTSSTENIRQLDNAIRTWHNDGDFVNKNALGTDGLMAADLTDTQDVNGIIVPKIRVKESGIGTQSFNLGSITTNVASRLQNSGVLMPGDIAMIQVGDELQAAVFGTQGEWVSSFGEF